MQDIKLPYNADLTVECLLSNKLMTLISLPKDYCLQHLSNVSHASTAIEQHVYTW